MKKKLKTKSNRIENLKKMENMKKVKKKIIDVQKKF